MVPHLITALTGPINELEQRIIDSMPAIERWFRLEWMEHTPPFYSSVDIRNSGFKLAPVDTNLFPGNWNNLTDAMLPLAVQATMASIEKICPEARNLLIIPENHNRNPSYLSNLAQLQRIFKMAGLNTRLGSISPDIKKPTELKLPNGESVLLEPVLRTKRRIGLKHFDPCTILLNNDLSWKSCTSNTCCLPCMQAGACAARAAIFKATKKWPSALASCWALTTG
jgi:glutamate--cysteine ligase